MSTLRVTNLKGGSAGSAPNLPDGAVITGVATVGVLSATTFYGSGANLTGIDATALKDSGGTVKIQANSTGAVVTGILTVSGNVSIGGTLTYEDVTNIDSVGIITARDGLKVTGGNLNVGTAITAYGSTGIVSATSYRGDGSQLSGIEAAPTIQLVTSENLVAGDTVVVKTNGQVEKVVKNVTQITPVNGQSVQISGSANGDEAQVALDPANPTRIYETYCHQNGNIYSRIGTITGTEDPDANVGWVIISTNLSPISSNSYEKSKLCNIGSGKFLIACGDHHVRVRVVTVNYSANTVATGTVVSLNGGNDCRNYDVESYGTDKAVISYRSNYDSKVYVVGVSVSGTTVTLGTPVEFDASTSVGDVNIRRATGTSKFLTTWYKDASDGLLCRMGDFNTGTNAVSIVGNELTIDSSFGTAIGVINALTYTKDNKWISTFKAVSGYHKGAVISYDGSSTITRGAILQISGNDTSHTCLVYDIDGDRTIDMFEDRDTGSGSLWATALSVSGTTLTASALDEVQSTNSCFIDRRGAAYSSYWGATYGVSEMGSSNNQYTILVTSSTVTTNSDTFVGFVGSSFSASSTATIQVVGNINANQSGLTPGSKYYVQKDGSIADTAGNPSVYAGRSLSATSLLIKG